MDEEIAGVGGDAAGEADAAQGAAYPGSVHRRRATLVRHGADGGLQRRRHVHRGHPARPGPGRAGSRHAAHHADNRIDRAVARLCGLHDELPRDRHHLGQPPRRVRVDRRRGPPHVVPQPPAAHGGRGDSFHYCTAVGVPDGRQRRRPDRGPRVLRRHARGVGQLRRAVHLRDPQQGAARGRRGPAGRAGVHHAIQRGWPAAVRRDARGGPVQCPAVLARPPADRVVLLLRADPSDPARGRDMSWTSALARRDPGLQAVRRAVRVAAAACIGFYAFRYGLHDLVMATYALFGAVALGALAQIPGAAAERARTMVAVLPVVALLILLGTALAGSTWAAIVGMLVVGFAVAFAGVGGPRLVGLAAGLQLFYILSSFPPYAPTTIGSRLVGVSIGILLLALAQTVLWPDRPAEGYESRLATACSRLADYAQALFTPSVPVAQRSAQEAAEALRPSRLPPQLRPA